MVYDLSWRERWVFIFGEKGKCFPWLISWLAKGGYLERERKERQKKDFNSDEKNALVNASKKKTA